MSITAEDLTFSYDGRPIFTRLAAQIALGKATVILGPNGSGKSTLAKLLLGHLRPQEGVCRFPFGFEQPGKTMAVYQDVAASLLPWFSAVENVALPLRCQGIRKDDALARSLAVMDELTHGVDPNALVARLSGGQQQTIAWARAFVTNPALAILDEPFASLDIRRIGVLISFLNRKIDDGLTAILILHDLDHALLLADAMLILSSDPVTLPRTVEVSIPKPRTADNIVAEAAMRIRREVLSAIWG